MELMNGKTIIQDLAKDLQGFFFHNQLTVKMEFDTNSRHHASYLGVDENERISFSKDLCNFVPNSLRDMFYIAIIACHEFSHYLNRHNSISDSENLDSVALETWADFYGARLFVTLITFGKRTRKSINKLNPNADQNIILDEIGKSLGDIHQYVYEQNTSKKYQPPLDRCSIFCAGVTSFFYRLYGTIKVNWSVHVNLTIIEGAGLTEQLGHNLVDWNEQDTISKRASYKHNQIQGRDSAIRKGLKPIWYPLISTSYGLDESQVQHHRQQMIQQIESQGISLRDEANA